jgi:nucleoid DNA-binding protein/DNA-directed RNA polymerase subunit RPC12/RpoP
MNIKKIEQVVAKELSMNRYDVNWVTSRIFEAMAAVLASGQDITVRGLGRLYWKATPKRRIIHPTTHQEMWIPERKNLKFKPAKQLRRLDMEKYGVVLDDQKVKEASQDGESRWFKCTKCGADLEKDESSGKFMLKCPKCGTEPFEKKE